MTGQLSPLRLDQILLQERLVTNDQIIEALHHQKEHGGKIGSHLMRFGYVDEAGLVRALAQQYGCEGIVLTDIDIPDIIIRFVPSKIAIARRVIPFDYNPEKNLLMVACPDPLDRYLIDELNFVARGKKVKLFIAVEQALKEAIERYYQKDVKLTGEAAAAERKRDKNASSESQTESPGQNHKPYEGECRGRLLAIGGNETERDTIKTLYEISGWEVQTVEDGARIPTHMHVTEFNQVIIKESDTEATENLRQQLRLGTNGTVFRTYNHLTDLTFDPVQENDTDLLAENLDLLVLMLGSKDKVAVNRSQEVGRMAGELCGKLNLSKNERAVITSAAYLHDLARYYYDHEDQAPEESQIVPLTVKLLKSLNYAPEVISVLEAVGREVPAENEIGLDVLGGSVITAVSEMVEVVPVGEKISSEKFASFRVWLAELTPRVVMAQVATKLLELVEEKLLASTTDGRYSHVLVLGEDQDRLDLIVNRLKQESFHPAVENNVEDFVTLYKRGEPDMIILVVPAREGELEKTVDRLYEAEVNLSAVPTFVLAESVTSQLSTLLDKGIEDIVPSGDNLNMLAAKMNRIRARVKATHESRKIDTTKGRGASTQGQLADMNLIDLVQVLGPSRKTVCLTLNGPDATLVLYMANGEITYAQCGNIGGVSAVYQGIRWTEGSWLMESIPEEDMPRRNVQGSNESIMMEGCRLLDEETRDHSPTGQVTTF